LFSGLFVEMWLKAMTEPYTRQEVDLVEKVLALTPRAKVLDVACGGGRHSLELAARGYQVTGVDFSPEFLAVARSSAEQRKLPITFEQRPMHDLPWQAEFDGAICLGNSLGLLDDEATLAAFRAVARALKPGGRFLVDNGAIAESILPNLKERFWWDSDDMLFLVQNCYDHTLGRLQMSFTMIRGNRVEKRTAFQQVYTYREFCLLLAQAGFSDFEGYSSPGREPFHLGAHNLILLARRA
jgi:SAM-dependent methyltransferase